MLTINKHIKSKLWINAKLESVQFQKICLHVLGKRVARGKLVELDIMFVNAKQIKHYNSLYRKKDAPTNTLSFPTYGPVELRHALSSKVPNIHLGEILLCFEEIKKEAINHGKLIENHVIHLVVHGLLHILGYNHDNDAEAVAMEKVEIDALEHFKIPNPYL